jgi:hypothetical protein
VTAPVLNINAEFTPLPLIWLFFIRTCYIATRTKHASRVQTDYPHLLISADSPFARVTHREFDPFARLRSDIFLSQQSCVSHALVNRINGLQNIFWVPSTTEMGCNYSFTFFLQCYSSPELLSMKIRCCERKIEYHVKFCHKWLPLLKEAHTDLILFPPQNIDSKTFLIPKCRGIIKSHYIGARDIIYVLKLVYYI